MTAALEQFLKAKFKERWRHPKCGHFCYPGRNPWDWCIECKYGDKPYH
jgi:hypothetical protein